MKSNNGNGASRKTSNLLKIIRMQFHFILLIENTHNFFCSKETLPRVRESLSYEV